MKKNRVSLYELLKRFLWRIGIERVNRKKQDSSDKSGANP